MLSYDNVSSELIHMKGKLLTLIDATLPSGQQNKATKDIVRQIVGSTINIFWRHVIGEEVFPKVSHSIKEL